MRNIEGLGFDATYIRDLTVYHQFLWIHVIRLPISFRVASLTLGQSYDCPSVSEVILKDMDKSDQYAPATIKQNNAGTMWFV